MEAKELRIGNWLINFIGDYFQVNAYTLVNLGLYPVTPIQLTEEILLKCGFKKLGKYTFVCNTSLMQLEIDVINNIILHSILAIEIKHLHQLQNLYFALTGEELEVCLK